MLNEIQMYTEEGGFEPVRGHEDDAGLDLRTPIDVIIPAGGSAVIDTKTHILIPKGYYGQLESKSGLNVNHSVVSLGGTIDAGYTGSIMAKMYNFGDRDFWFRAGDKVVQMIIQSCETPRLVRVNGFPETDRGNGGFGSTGR